MRSLGEHMEALFMIYDEKGNLVKSSEDDGRLAKIKIDSLPYSGTYNLFIMDKGGNDQDQYGFSLQLLNHHDCTEDFTYCQLLNAELPFLASRNAYHLYMEKDQRIILQLFVNDASIEGEIEIYDSHGKLLFSQVAKGKKLEAELDEKETGSSILIITQDQHGNDTGWYGLSIQTLINNKCASPLACFDMELTGKLEQVPGYVPYYIDGFAGDNFTFRMKADTESASMEPLLRLYDPDGKLMAEDSQAHESVLKGRFIKDGKYLLLAGDKGSNDTGSFSIRKEAPFPDMALPGCMSVFKGYPGTECISISPVINKAEAEGFNYLWSTGETTSAITVCPEKDLEVTVQVWSDRNCLEEYSSFLNVSSALCQGVENMISICHHPSDGATPYTACVSPPDVEFHIAGAQGHDLCHVGSCDTDPCGVADNNINEDESTFEEKHKGNRSISTYIFPNPASDKISISWQYPLKYNPMVRVLDFYGRNIITHKISTNDTYTVLDLPDYLVNGMYIVVLEDDFQRIAKKLQIIRSL